MKVWTFELYCGFSCWRTSNRGGKLMKREWYQILLHIQFVSAENGFFSLLIFRLSCWFVWWTFNYIERSCRKFISCLHRIIWHRPECEEREKRDQKLYSIWTRQEQELLNEMKFNQRKLGFYFQRHIFILAPMMARGYRNICRKIFSANLFISRLGALFLSEIRWNQENLISC